MPGIADAKAVRATQLAQKLLTGYVSSNPMAIDRVTDELAREDDPELFILVLSRTAQVAAEILTMLAGRVGANPRRAIDDAFTKWH